jgi:hypothetical protein
MQNNPKTVFYFFLAVTFITASTMACSLLTPASTPVPTATFTQLPTLAPSQTPTDTPAPTSTLKPTATVTPDYMATQEADQKDAIQEVLSGYDLPSDPGQIEWYQNRNQKIAIKLDGPSGFYIKMDEIQDISDFVFSTNMVWDTDAWPFCGVMFRSDNRWDKGDYYLLEFLRVSGLPAWEIDYYKDGKFVNLATEKVRFSSFLNLEDGASNHIVLSAVGNEFKVYINDNFEGRFFDYSNRLSHGKFGFIGYQGSGKTTCSFTNSWIWGYK